jgi:hypothetical protein
VSFRFEALERTAAFLATPHLLTVMASVADGQQPYMALPGVMPEQIDAAVQRLLEVGVARLVVDTDQGTMVNGGQTSCPVKLTRKGWRVLELVRDLQEPADRVSDYANSERAVRPSEQMSEK